MDENPKITLASPLLVVAQSIEEADLLKALAGNDDLTANAEPASAQREREQGEQSGSASCEPKRALYFKEIAPPDAINELIAAILLRLKIRAKKALLLAITTLIRRSMHHTFTATKTAEDMLLRLQEQLRRPLKPTAMLDTGLMLGDSAIHREAGWDWGNKGDMGLKRLMGADAFRRYARRASRRGYETALNASRRVPPETAMRTSSIPEILAKHTDVVRVLEHIHSMQHVDPKFTGGILLS